METIISSPASHNQSSVFTTIFNSSCRFDEEFKYILLPVSYSLVFVVGFVLNATALWVFLKMRPWNPSTVFMFHLALSDFLILLLTCISVHRYLGICHPIKALTLVKSRHAHLVCGMVWAMVSVCLVPNLIFVTTSRRDNDTLCHDTTSQGAFEEYVDYSSVVMGLSSSQQGTATSQKSIKLIIVVLVVFAVSFVPFHITRTLYYTSRVLNLDCKFLNIVNFTYKITRPLASINSCIDPILYFMAGDHYRSKMMSVLRARRQTTSSQTPERSQTRPKNHHDIALAYKNTAIKASEDSENE
ncbi:P2Y purinoceptor 4 [Dissostichus eleginoides]|uniref:P2Y purinoceptor 4 n=1 Tax=Dissostichus eleginoides TaxID=100907 RepID=A0AAD9CMG0_DISEL|nr:P2Y purinoceptor 4 [Dissostichus eleginoides]